MYIYYRVYHGFKSHPRRVLYNLKNGRVYKNGMAELVDAWGLEPHRFSVTVQLRLPVPTHFKVLTLNACLGSYVKIGNCCF